MSDRWFRPSKYILIFIPIYDIQSWKVYPRYLNVSIHHGPGLNSYLYYVYCVFPSTGLAGLIDFIFASIHINENFNCTLETRQMVLNNDISVKYLFLQDKTPLFSFLWEKKEEKKIVR